LSHAVCAATVRQIRSGACCRGSGRLHGTGELVSAGGGRVIARIGLVDKVDMLLEAFLRCGAHDIVKIWSSLLHRNPTRVHEGATDHLDSVCLVTLALTRGSSREHEDEEGIAEQKTWGIRAITPSLALHAPASVVCCCSISDHLRPSSLLCIHISSRSTYCPLAR
jgi:hypothetical protein